MKKIKYVVLIIDDHPLIVSAYRDALDFISKKNQEISFHIKTASDCETAFVQIEASENKIQKFDLIFLDIKLPPSKNHKILNGEGLGIIIKERLPDCKIIISTTFNDNFRIYNIFQSINPEGFLIKNEITSKELTSAIEDVLNNKLYYSDTVTKHLRNEASNNLFLDKIDRKILFELSRGTKMSKLPNFVPLSLAGIEKRKRRLKELFGVTKENDKSLIVVAREKGFV